MIAAPALSRPVPNGRSACRCRWTTGLPALGIGLFLLVAILATSATAQTITVRSGEHAGFTRLAMVVSPPTGWSFTGEGESYRLVLDRDTLRLDTSEVFRFIPRSRLAELRSAPDAPALTLRLACPCDVRAFEDRPGILVIDIADPSASPAPPPPSEAADLTPGADLATLDLARELLGPRLGPVAAVPASRPTVPFAATATGADPTPARTSRPDPAPPVAPDDPALRLATAVARAATQGLLSPPTSRIGTRTPRPGGATGDAEPAQERRPEAPSTAPPAASPEAPTTAIALPGIRTGTAFDLSAGAGMQGDPRTEALRCLPDRALDLASWGSDRPVSEALGTALAATTGEFDRIDPVAVRRLVRLYLHLGFGAEARATLRAFAPPPLPEDAVMLSLADILDHGSEAEPSNLWQMTDCAGAAALWAVLARPQLSDEVVVNEASLLQAFAALPPHLRRHLGPRLAERLLAFGRPTLATAVVEATRHAAAQNAAALELAMTRVALARGEQAATRQLAALAEGHDEAALGARLLLAEGLLDRGAAPDPALVAEIEAEAFARRGTDEAGRFVRVVVLGHAAMGDIPAALAAMGRAGAASDAIRPDGPLLWQELLARTVRDTPAPDFLRVLLTLDQWRGGMSPSALRFQIADRLMELGLVRLAAEALSPDPTLPEERLRLARILFDLGYPAEAMRRLAGLDSVEAARLRAAALTALGDVGGALGAHERAGDQDAIARLVWRAGLWDLVRDIGAPEERALLPLSEPTGASEVEPVPGPAGQVRQPPPSLSEVRAAITASQDLRASVTGLLNLHRIP